MKDLLSKEHDSYKIHPLLMKSQSYPFFIWAPPSLPHLTFAKKIFIPLQCVCNWTRTQNHLVCKWTLNHLAKLRARSFLTFRQLWSVDSLWNTYVTWSEHIPLLWFSIQPPINKGGSYYECVLNLISWNSPNEIDEGCIWVWSGKSYREHLK